MSAARRARDRHRLCGAFAVLATYATVRLRKSDRYAAASTMIRRRQLQPLVTFWRLRWLTRLDFAATLWKTNVGDGTGCAVGVGGIQPIEM